MFPNFRRLRRKGVKCPVLLIHGTADEVVSVQHSLQLLLA